VSNAIVSSPSISIAPFRVGSVPYLNAAPLTAGIEHAVQFVVPARLAEMLRQNELDAALVSVAEVLFNDRYDVLDGTAIGSMGAVFSVHLAHRRPLTEITEVYCDTASLTGVNLLRVLLAERGLKPEFRPLPGYEAAIDCDAVLLIGDRAIDFRLAPHPHQILDLGQDWQELTGLPFVYAVWAMRREIEHEPLRRALLAARDWGLKSLPDIIRDHADYTEEFRRQYFERHVRYGLGQREKAGIGKFIELLRKLGLGPVHEPHYVE
jgi:chorismate dehydratase